MPFHVWVEELADGIDGAAQGGLEAASSYVDIALVNPSSAIVDVLFAERWRIAPPARVVAIGPEASAGRSSAEA